MGETPNSNPENRGLEQELEQQPEIPEAEIESYDQKIIESNLKIFVEDMEKLLYEESWGGNAGVVKVDGKNRSCAAANGFIDSMTGEIVAFCNFPGDLKDPKIVKDKLQIALRVADCYGKVTDSSVFLANFLKTLKIVDYNCEEGLTKNGQINLEKSIEEYNASHKKDIEENNK